MKLTRIMSSVAIASVPLIVFGPAKQDTGSPDKTEISIHVKPMRPKAVTGDPIELSISINNDSQRSLFIGRDLPGLQSDAAHVSFLVSDKLGRSPQGHVTVADRFTPNPEGFANAVMRNWIAMPPQSSYSFSTDVRRYAPEFFEKPGLYKVQATYTSAGIRTQIINQRLNATDKDINGLPFPAWEGTVQSLRDHSKPASQGHFKTGQR